MNRPLYIHSLCIIAVVRVINSDFCFMIFDRQLCDSDRVLRSYKCRSRINKNYYRTAKNGRDWGNCLGARNIFK